MKRTTSRAVTVGALGRAMILALLVVLSGCSADKATEVVVSIATDLRVPVDMDELRLKVQHLAKTVDKLYDLNPAHVSHLKLPATIGLVAGQFEDKPMLITITGRHKGKDLVERRARLPWAHQRILLLRMNLLRSCVARVPSCSSEETCTEDGCKPIDVDPNTLPDYTPELALAGLDVTLPDAGMDQGPGPDQAPPDQTPQPDALLPDQSLPDQALLDQAPPDQSPPDQAVPDQSLPDQSLPDQSLPDQSLPDLPKPDAPSLIPGTWKTLATKPPVTFKMGVLPKNDVCNLLNHTNPPTRHSVTLTRSFEISIHEVTQVQFQKVMGYNNSMYKTCGGFCPVENVSWYEALRYCNALSDLVGKDKCYVESGSGQACSNGPPPPPVVSCPSGSDEQCVKNKCIKLRVAPKYTGAKTLYDCPGYRLPTEAEWEYAARAGATTEYHNNKNVYIISTSPLKTACSLYKDPNLDPIAWFQYNASWTTQPVGTKQPNAWGLYDTLGNVWEWVHDWHDKYPAGPVTDPLGPAAKPGTYGRKVNRGGSHVMDPAGCQLSIRFEQSPYHHDADIGFRCVRTISP